MSLVRRASAPPGARRAAVETDDVRRAARRALRREALRWWLGVAALVVVVLWAVPPPADARGADCVAESGAEAHAQGRAGGSPQAVGPRRHARQDPTGPAAPGTQVSDQVKGHPGVGVATEPSMRSAILRRWTSDSSTPRCWPSAC